jgi:pSer/pThr/pTyr-binding forkhead associated (FHA) protein
MHCLLCSSPHTLGVLCTQHGAAIASAGITSEQISSRARDPGAALIDAWGCAHGIADGTRVGRDREQSDVAVLHASVSGLHATFGRVRNRWRIVDDSSRNGTEIDGRRVDNEPVTAGDVIAFGDVTFYFWDQMLPKGEPPRGQGRTARSRNLDPYRANLLTVQGSAIELLQRIDDGVVRTAGTSVELAMMEFAFLRLLVDRRRQQSDPEFAYVAWHEIADALAFRSIETDGDNVRELVHRVRRKLGELGSLIESKRGVGYRIAATPS